MALTCFEPDIPSGRIRSPSRQARMVGGGAADAVYDCCGGACFGELTFRRVDDADACPLAPDGPAAAIKPAPGLRLDQGVERSRRRGGVRKAVEPAWCG